MSKGSNRRPKQVPKEKFDSNWDQIFNKPKKNEKKKLDFIS